MINSCISRRKIKRHQPSLNASRVRNRRILINAGIGNGLSVEVSTLGRIIPLFTYWIITIRTLADTGYRYTSRDSLGFTDSKMRQMYIL
jgi:hypothetical protein